MEQWASINMTAADTRPLQQIARLDDGATGRSSRASPNPWATPLWIVRRYQLNLGSIRISPSAFRHRATLQNAGVITRI